MLICGFFDCAAMNYFSEKKKQAAQTRQEQRTYHHLGDLEGMVPRRGEHRDARREEAESCQT
jgi:hypothetical protein